MKKRVTVKRIVFLSFFLLLPLQQLLHAQEEDPFEMDDTEWSEDGVDESLDEPFMEKETPSPKPAQPQQTKKLKSAELTKKSIEAAPASEDFDEEDEEIFDFDDSEEEAPLQRKKQPAAVSPPTQTREPAIKSESIPPPTPYHETAAPPPQTVVSKPKAVFQPITQTKSEYTVGSVVKRAGPPLVLISRPVYAPYSTENKTMFISAIAEAYFHFKIGALPGIQVVPFERIANNVQYFRDFSRRISRTTYIEAAKKIGAAYLFYQEYEPKGKKVKFATELYSITDNKKISGRTSEIALSGFENGLFDLVNEVAGALIGTLPNQTQELLAAPVLGSNERQIALLGQAIVSLGDFSQKKAEKAAPEFEKLARDRVMHLAKFIGAQTLARARLFDKATALQRQLIATFGRMYPGLSLPLAAYYRMQESYGDALTAASEASREPSLKLPSQIEKARIYEAEGKLDQAKREYESVLSTGGEDGEIYFQLALVSIGLNDLRQAERYLEKAAAAGRTLDRGDYFDLGLRYKALGTANEEAINAFRNSLGLQQDNEDAWRQLAEIYSLSGREAEAAACYVSLFQINNEVYKEYLLKAGIMFENAGYLENAKDAYSLFIARRFDNPEVSVRLAKLEMQSGNCAKAIELVDGMDTLGEFGQDVIAINTQCEKKERRVSIPTGTGRDKTWRRVFFWRVSSGAIAVAGVVGGLILDNQAKETHKKYIASQQPSEVESLHSRLETFVMARNLFIAGAGVGMTSFALSITLPIIFSDD
ncbi:MAG: tetratricopeptide repeat protein [Chitinispirillaceae bacterium]|nr:tetratricopeptide repeat protein [Chitinispirillaceae bacterium]